MTSTHYLSERWCLNCDQPVRVAPNLQNNGPLWVWYHVREDSHLEERCTSDDIWMHRRYCDANVVPGDIYSHNGLTAIPNIVVSDEETEEYLGELDDLQHELDDLAVD